MKWALFGTSMKFILIKLIENSKSVNLSKEGEFSVTSEGQLIQTGVSGEMAWMRDGLYIFLHYNSNLSKKIYLGHVKIPCNYTVYTYNDYR